MDSGVFTAAGNAKKAWSKLTESAGPADATFTVEDATGWLTGDRIVLTPPAESSVPEHYLQFDEAVVAGVVGQSITLEAAPAYEHAGCIDCVRRGEAVNLSRNVIVRSYDDTAHAHIIVPAGVKPFLFGWHMNRNSLWEVRNFTHPDYPSLPANFDLYRADNEVAGGNYNAEFDAWLVPR